MWLVMEGAARFVDIVNEVRGDADDGVGALDGREAQVVRGSSTFWERGENSDVLGRGVDWRCKEQIPDREEGSREAGQKRPAEQEESFFESTISIPSSPSSPPNP